MNPDPQYGYPPQAPPPAPQPGYVPLQPAPLPPVNNYIAPPKPSKLWIILTVVFILTTIAAIAGAVYSYMNYTDQKDNVDAKVSTAVNTAVKDRADADAAAFLEKEKQPNRQFAGPEDYGRVSFDYPKTWSIYVDQDATGGDTYKAYFNPVSVPPIDAATQYALRVTIEQKDYERVLASYDSLVKKGDLQSSSVKADGIDGTRLDGSFTKDIRGSAIIFKIRDKTVTMRTDASTFSADFNALISTITFNK